MSNYKNILAEKLDELKEIEGFPIGADEEIIKFSNPPFYTACPNPFINEYLDKYSTPYDEKTDTYHCEPFLEDVSEGKNDPFYLAHTYHTKVPPSAISKYIKHFTKPGDIVADFFSGSGMTGVAAQLNNRRAILSDLSPIASYITRCFNSHIPQATFIEKVKSILLKAQAELSYLFETKHTNGQNAKINYVVWSEVLISPYNKEEFIYYNIAYDRNNGELLDVFKCPFTDGEIIKKECPKAYIEVFDDVLKRKVKQVKLVPVLINYTANGKTFDKEPDGEDLEVLEDVQQSKIPYWFPTDEIPKGEKTGEPIRAGFTHIHHLYFKRVIWVLSKIHNELQQDEYAPYLLTILTSAINRNLFKGNRFVINKYNPNGRINGPLSGTLFIPPLIVEQNPFKLLSYKLESLVNMFSTKGSNNGVMVSTQSITDFSNIRENSVDYVFTDPPFGANIMYSELNFIWEAWLKIRTNNKDEAIINKSQNKSLEDYYDLMLKAFKTYYRVLKPKRWITVEFHNSKSSVWNKIQEALTKAGFVVANVRILDKQKGTINQSYIHGTVKSDLVISAFKPSRRFEEVFLRQAGLGLELDFVNEFLSRQPVKPVLERTEKMLYSKMLSFYIQHSYEVQYDAKSFYRLLRENFFEDNGYWFTADQINSYEEHKKQLKLKGISEIKEGRLMMFITDEKSALVWLYDFLSTPQSFQDIHTAFIQLVNIQDDSIPELRELLEQNFVLEADKYRRPKSDVEHDLVAEKRQRNLLKEFESLLIKAKTERSKIKIVRKEAVLFGFEYCYKQKRFSDIILISKKLDKAILENNSELHEFVEAAEIMLQGVA